MMKLGTISLIVAVILIAAVAWATPQYRKVFDNTYKPAKGTALAKAGCLTCHKTMGSPEINPYGADVKKAMGKSKTLTGAILHKIDKMDSDKDGATNIAEIKAGTLPGDPKSKPKKVMPLMKPVKPAPKKK